MVENKEDKVIPVAQGYLVPLTEIELEDEVDDDVNYNGQSCENGEKIDMQEGENIAVAEEYNEHNPLNAKIAPTEIEAEEDNADDIDYNFQHGEIQPKKCNDVFFAILFYAHLAIMFFLNAVASPPAYRNYNNNGNSDAMSVIFLLVGCGIVATALFIVAFRLMMKFSSRVIEASFFTLIGSSVIMMLGGFMSGSIEIAIVGLLSSAFQLYYIKSIWHRIPFATANFTTALTAIKANLGIFIVAYFISFLGFCWVMWWFFAVEEMVDGYGVGILVLGFLSLFWTQQVLKNTVHVTTVGVIATWWFAPQEASPMIIRDSFSRAATHSFGSICFGSLLVAFVQALRALSEYFLDPERPYSVFLTCIIDCIFSCIQSIIEYLNQWAYVYVGLYGYNYLDAGKNVVTLFKNKGWSFLITDNLMDNLLFMMSLVIGLLTGIVGLLVIQFDNDGVGIFLDAFFIGLFLSSMLMGVVGSAVNTIIVCFAEAPAEFEMNHPDLSSEMRAAWRQAWPEECEDL